jgi:1-acyl-sn-glycerol-3-phosphate acyltransferase
MKLLAFPFYTFVAIISQPVRLLYRLRATGLENVPREGGFVLASNHLSNLDPWPLGLTLFPRRHPRFMAKSELYWFPLGKLLDWVGAFPVDRGARDTSALDTAVKLAQDGEVVGMFPHGTRLSKGLRKKREPKAHTGAARIAIAAGVPIVPVAIKGTDRLTRLGPMRVAYGKPMAAEGGARQLTDRVMAEIDRLQSTL